MLAPAWRQPKPTCGARETTSWLLRNVPNLPDSSLTQCRLDLDQWLLPALREQKAKPITAQPRSVKRDVPTWRAPHGNEHVRKTQAQLAYRGARLHTLQARFIAAGASLRGSLLH